MTDPRTRASDELVLSVPADPGVISIARLFVAAACRHAGADEDLIDDAKIAVSEAVTNAVKAHLEASEQQPLRVVVRQAGEGELTVEVVDAGPGFDVEHAAPDTATPPAGLYEGSLGLTVIRSLFPSLQITRNADRGMTVSFTVAIQPANR